MASGRDQVATVGHERSHTDNSVEGKNLLKQEDEDTQRDFDL